MDDLADSCGLSRAALYRLFGDVLGVLVAVAEVRLLPPWDEPLSQRGDHRRLYDPAHRIAAVHDATGELEMVVRGVAAAGAPRARAVIARLDLQRREAALSLLPALRWQRDERMHLVQLVLLPYGHHALRVRAGWSHEEYAGWLGAELHHLDRWSAP